MIDDRTFLTQKLHGLEACWHLTGWLSASLNYCNVLNAVMDRKMDIKILELNGT